MGYIKHDAIVVTCWKKTHTAKARRKARELGLEVTGIITSRVEGWATFLIVPDGSKEGWPDSDKAELARNSWKEWAKANRKKLYLEWVHVEFGGDDPLRTDISDHGGFTP